MSIRKFINAARPLGAGALFPTPDWMNRPESFWPTGSVAFLAVAYPADRGLDLPPKLVDQFEKKSNGRWLSQPGNDISFPSLGALSNAAPINHVITPSEPRPEGREPAEGGSEPETPGAEAPPGAIQEQPDTDPDGAMDPEAPSPGRKAGGSEEADRTAKKVIVAALGIMGATVVVGVTTWALSKLLK